MRNQGLSVVITFILLAFGGSCSKNDAQSNEPYDAVYYSPTAAVYVKMTSLGEMFYNFAPKAHRLYEGEDVDRKKANYLISRDGALLFYPIDEPSLPIQFFLSHDRKRLQVKLGFPGDAVTYSLILDDPESQHLKELHNL
jgi:hypothetical protein